jgi:hypothetical protein
MKDSVIIAATGTPAASSTTPSAAAAALHEPQSPTPVTTTSEVAAISLMTLSGSGTAKFVLVRLVTVTPYRSVSRRPTSSRKGLAFVLVLMSRPTRAPERLARRGARGAACLAALVVTVPVGSRIAFGMVLGLSLPCFSARRRCAA